MKLHAYLATVLADRGVDTIFGLIGDGNLFFVDHFVRRGGRYFGAVHETNTVMMAAGYATATGRLGVATVTHGPGLANTIVSLVEAVKSNTPVLLICGDTAGFDNHHPQSVDQRSLVTATGAGFEQVRSPQTIGFDLENAIKRVASERRPIVLNVPVDFMWAELDTIEPMPRTGTVRHSAEVQRPEPDPVALDVALGLILTARRPIVLAGRGAIGSKQAVTKFADRLGAPVATTVLAKDLFIGHELDLGVFGSFATPVTQDVILESDCVVVFGAGLNLKTSDGGSLLEGKIVVQCDLDGRVIGRFHNVDAALVGDCGVVAEKMSAMLDEAEHGGTGIDRSKLRARMAAWPAFREHHSPGTIDVTAALTHFDKTLPSNGAIAADAGRFTAHVMKLMHTEGPSSWLNSWTGFASIGLGMGMALGGAAGRPDRLTTLVTGDGGFMLGGMNEFATASRYGLDLVCIVCNDGSYGAEHIQFVNRGLDPSLSVFEWPDLAALSGELGGVGVTVRGLDDLRAADAAIESRTTPVLIDVRLDPNLC